MTTTTSRAGGLARLRILALAERARYRHGWGFHGDRVTQRCPCCHATVHATAPDPPQDPTRGDHYTRQIHDLLNDAVFEHLHHDCPTPDQERR